jgi:alanyl-tRNA synthetase
VIIDQYGEAYPELEQNRKAILDNLTREEQRFQRTVEGGVAQLENELAALKKGATLSGATAFELYATYGLPLEISRDIARERGLEVDDAGFQAAMEAHREASGGGQAMGALGGEDVEVYRQLIADLKQSKQLSKDGVEYDPYSGLSAEGEVLALVRDGQVVDSAKTGDQVAVLLPRTNFYVASGGQISDTGEIRSKNGKGWRIRVDDTVQPAAGAIVHLGEVVEGSPRVGDAAVAEVARQRRQDIMRNHTATHLLHAALHQVLGEHARQAGSLVALDRLRFDFNHPEAMSSEQIREVEDLVNGWALDNYALKIEYKKLDQAKKEGAIALFGEKYGEEVRTIAIGGEELFSYELCGGTHLERTGDIGVFLITSEASAAAGIRRIEAVTGREAYNLLRSRMDSLSAVAGLLDTNVDFVVGPVENTLGELKTYRIELKRYRQKDIENEQIESFANFFLPEKDKTFKVFLNVLDNADDDMLMSFIDKTKRELINQPFVTIAASGEKSNVISKIWVSQLLQIEGIEAGKLARELGKYLGGGGGGSKSLGQAGGSEVSKLKTLSQEKLIDIFKNFIETKIQIKE